MWVPLLAFVLIVLHQVPSIASLFDAFQDQLVTYLRPDEPHIQDGQTLLKMLYVQNRVHVYCQRPAAPTVWNVFRSSRLHLQIAAGGEYSQYKGATVQEVYQAHRERTECYEGKPLGLSAQEHRIVSLAAHSHACYGIYTDHPFVLTLVVVSCDLERVAQFSFGFVLWLSSPHLADSLLCLYCSAAALGAHLAGVVVVGIALLASGDGRPLRLRPLKGNFKQVLEEKPTVMALALVGGAWALQSTCQRFSSLWRRPLLRCLHRRLLRITAYWLILTASDHRGFGWVCLSVLLPWPELWWLLRWLRTQYVRHQRRLVPPKARPLLSEEEFQARSRLETLRAVRDLRDTLRQNPPSWQLVSQLQQPQHFARFLSGGSHLGNPRPDFDPILSQRKRCYGPDHCSTQGNSSISSSKIRRRHEKRERQGEENSSASNYAFG
ncbi:uncharacterized protein LOC128253142 isoform X2 [Drosophila gunungcola]|uniref:uncharacterized protein LOC128253142 isoform X2 n=1 Tax=Drosophila gunungcola TaxID=103775 RepID=UPI0022E48662|nr:uncharacterized protein LOC128253142 isoform X2 [Drosophila gunungcola]